MCRVAKQNCSPATSPLVQTANRSFVAIWSANLIPNQVNFVETKWRNPNASKSPINHPNNQIKTNKSPHWSTPIPTLAVDKTYQKTASKPWVSLGTPPPKRNKVSKFPERCQSGQIIIFHQPRFPWNKGIFLPQLPFGVRSCEVAIIWPD